MNALSLTPDIAILTGHGERTVLVCGNSSATAIDLPASVEGIQAVMRASENLTTDGLKTAILTHEADDCKVNANLPAVSVLRADRMEEADEEWDWDRVPQELLQGPFGAVHLVRCPQTLYDDSGRSFHIEPCLGSSRSVAVLIEPEDILVCCDDLHPELPPRINPGRVHETIMRLEDWRMRSPRMLIPASGIPLRDEVVVETLDRGIQYLRTLYQQTRTGLTEMRVPWERLVYMIPAGALWQPGGTNAAVIERHRANVRYMAEDIFQRVQGEAEERSLATAADAA